MRWEAANVARRHPNPHDDAIADEPSTLGNTQRRRSTETAEAALARLTKAYSVAMTCVGALHRASSALYKSTTLEKELDPSNSATQQKQQLERVAGAARTALENAVLLDPLILAHAPTFYKTIRKIAEEDPSTTLPTASERRWGAVLDAPSRPAPPVLTSSAHRSTVRQLAYLSLVNYSDLLLSSCACCHRRRRHGIQDNSTSHTILDKGVTPRLKILQQTNHSGDCCCWSGEAEAVTQRLALVALCDSSELDGSDPSLWLKLACTARSLGRVVVLAKNGDNAFLNIKGGVKNHARGIWQYRRLERHALERGISALPEGVPPNRTIVRALNELNQAEAPENYFSKLIESHNDTTTKLLLDLPRYSWSVLGRMLMRACREGAAYRFDITPGRKHEQRKGEKIFGSPRISLRISPMLALPPSVLGTICQFLEERYIWRFEATCRALSVSLMSARALMEQAHHNNSMTARKDRNLSDTEMEVTHNPTESTNEKSETKDKNNKGGDHRDAPRQEQPMRSYRTSKRVMSQLITSGKMAERKSKRASVEFCFLASVLSCSEDDLDYLTQSKGQILWENSLLASDGSIQVPYGSLGLGSSLTTANARSSAQEMQSRQQNEARERSGEASLVFFTERWSCRNSGPIDVLSKFLAHIALNVEDVFANASEDMMGLSSCVTDCA